MDEVAERIRDLQKKNDDQAKQYARAIRFQSLPHTVTQKQDRVIIETEYFKSVHKITETETGRNVVVESGEYETTISNVEFTFTCRTLPDEVQRHVNNQINKQRSTPKTDGGSPNTETPTSDETTSSTTPNESENALVEKISQLWNR